MKVAGSKENPELRRRNSSARSLFYKIVPLIFIIILGYFALDYVGPSEIHLREKTVFGIESLSAKDLIVQEFDDNGDLWATRGMIVYKLTKGDSSFEKVAHIPTGFNIFWIRNFTVVRRLTIRPECVEMTTTQNGDICAVSAGKLWVRHPGEKKFSKSMDMTHYGIGDQGIRNAGIVSVENSTVYFGEYFQNSNQDEVRIFGSNSDLTDWETSYEFEPGEIQHIHAIQFDPFSENLWICTGDQNSESMVGWSDDNFKTIQKIGEGSQQWRVCQLVFTEEFVYWGTDNGTQDVAGIYRWNRETKEVEKVMKVDGAVFYGTQLSNGTIVMSTDREGMGNEIDDKTRIIVIPEDHDITKIVCGTWDHNNPGFWFKFAKLRFQRNQGSPFLAVSVLNQKEVRDGDLVLIHEDSLLSVN